MKKTLGIVAGVLLVVIALVAVISMTGNKDSMESKDMSQNATDRPAASEPAETSADAIATNTVEITDFKFMPGNIKVKVGDTVTWTNNDTVRHNVQGVDNELPEGPLLSQGETYTHTFTKAGVYDYICTPHPYMKASVTVE